MTNEKSQLDLVRDQVLVRMGEHIAKILEVPKEDYVPPSAAHLNIAMKWLERVDRKGGGGDADEFLEAAARAREMIQKDKPTLEEPFDE